MSIKFTRRRTPEYNAHVKEVVKILNNKPCLLIRIEISGDYFPHRAPHPFIILDTEKEKYKDLFTEISMDGQKLIGYFPLKLPTSGIIEFGYGAEIWGVVPKEFSDKFVVRLDRKRLVKDLVVVDTKDQLEKF